MWTGLICYTIFAQGFINNGCRGQVNVVGAVKAVGVRARTLEFSKTRKIVKIISSVVKLLCFSFEHLLSLRLRHFSATVDWEEGKKHFVLIDWQNCPIVLQTFRETNFGDSRKTAYLWNNLILTRDIIVRQFFSRRIPKLYVPFFDHNFDILIHYYSKVLRLKCFDIEFAGTKKIYKNIAKLLSW